MKSLIFLLLLVLSLVRCGGLGGEFTITNTTSGEEDVFVYVSEDGGLKKITIAPSSCIVVYGRDFESMAIKATRGTVFTGEKTLCGGEGEVRKCVPTNYEIKNAGEWIDDYQLIPDTSKQNVKDCSSLLE